MTKAELMLEITSIMLQQDAVGKRLMDLGDKLMKEENDSSAS